MAYPDTDAQADAAIAAWLAGHAPVEQTVAVPSWRLEGTDVTELSVRYACAGSADAPTLTARVDGSEFPLDDPVLLEPVTVPKPWGGEVWFTGSEARGESRVVGDGGSLDLSSYLALAPGRICRREPIVLLKILAPRPEPVLGELYLEVHREKREVYVVTRVDETAWPDGLGRIRHGVDQGTRARYGSDDAFRAAFLAAIRRYEQVRRAIDGGAAGLEEAERSALSATRPFVAERPLAVGDVVTVPPWTPHSLQHGVEVIEFQTPTYERFVIASTQAVVTQDHWDSRHAIEHMTLDPPTQLPAEVITPGIERIARFDDFAVWRADLESADSFRLPLSAPYAVALCVSGAVALSGPGRTLRLDAGHAALVPAGSVGREITVLGSGLSLYAAPGL